MKWSVRSFRLKVPFQGVTQELDVLDKELYVGREGPTQVREEGVGGLELPQDSVVADGFVELLVSLAWDPATGNDQV